MAISPVVVGFGVFYWFKYYRSARGYYPKFLEVWKKQNVAAKKNSLSGMHFLSKYILEIWTLNIIMWVSITLCMSFIFRQSDAFAAIKTTCETDKQILAKTGKISYYGVLIGGTIKGNNDYGSADLSFTVVSTNGNFPGYAQLTKRNVIWIVRNLAIFDKKRF